jgi:hypothetical protein
MFGFSRPSRRPHAARRSSTRSVLRVEALETRANPSAPMINVAQATWSDPNDIVITGTVTDANPAGTFLSLAGGGSLNTAYANSVGGFQIALHLNNTGPVSLVAHDSLGLNSSAMTFNTGVAQSIQYGAPSIGNVQITWGGTGWVLTGSVSGMPGGESSGTVVQVTDPSGHTQTVMTNPDGSFSAGVGSFGGTFTLKAINYQLSTESDTFTASSGF